MNIDLKNVSREFEKAVNDVKYQYGISTNSKAVEFAVVNYMEKVKLIEALRRDLNSLGKDLKVNDDKICLFKRAFEDLIR